MHSRRNFHAFSFNERNVNRCERKRLCGWSYNLNNLEFTQAILEASQEENAPVILGVSEGAARYMSGFYTVVKMVEGLMHDLNITIPVAIHLDHGSSFENVKKQLMLDSHL